MTIASQANQSVNQTHTQTHERDDDKHLNQRVSGDSTGILTDPTDGFGNDSADITNQSCHSSRSGSRAAFLLSSITHYLHMHHPGYKTSHNKEDRQTGERRNRFGHQETGQLGNKPRNKVHHCLHSIATPILIKQYSTIAKMAAEQSQG